MRKAISMADKFCLKHGHQYYGIINVIGAPVLLKTERLTRANLYPAEEVGRIVGQLERNGISATPVAYDQEISVYNKRMDMLQKKPLYAVV